MGENEISKLKGLLLRQLASILNQLSLCHSSSIDRVEGADEVDDVVNEQSLTMTMQLHERDRRFLVEVDYTLAKFDNQTFGVCECCQSGIHIKRLLARPIARYCVTCQEDQEHQTRHYA